MAVSIAPRNHCELTLAAGQAIDQRKGSGAGCSPAVVQISSSQRFLPSVSRIGLE